MNPIVSKARIACALGACTLASGAFAAEPSAAVSRYQQERAACLSGQTTQDRETCLREAGAALEQARRGSGVAGTPAELEQNRLRRCEAHAPQDRAECVRRMNEGTATGSVGAGGIYRELVTRSVE